MIEQPSESQTGSGEPQASWSTFATRWGSIREMNGREFFDADHIVEEEPVRIEMRYLSGITKKMRIKDGDNVIYDIRAISDPAHLKHRMEILATKRSVDN